MTNSALSVAEAPPVPLAPETIHSCPNCSHWLAEGTLACPDCGTLTYRHYLSEIAASAKLLESEGKWAEAQEQWTRALRWVPDTVPQRADLERHVTAIDARLQAETEKKDRWTRRLGPFAPIFFFLLKAKSALFLLFKVKFLFGLLSFFGLYWAIFGWRFALGFTICLMIHEMGHYVAARRRGLKADLPLFLPGLGAYVRWYSQGTSREDLAAIALAGPVYGLVAALGCAALYWGTGNGIFLVLANVGAWVNLFNLLPILGLDGAQATFALSRLQRGLIVATSVLFFALTTTSSAGPANVQWVFLIVAAGMAWRCFRADLPERGDTRTSAVFQGLVLLLGLLLYRSGAMLNILQTSWAR